MAMIIKIVIIIALMMIYPNILIIDMVVSEMDIPYKIPITKIISTSTGISFIIYNLPVYEL